MIVFAGIVPHPPLVIPEIGKNDSKKVNKTFLAYEKIAKDLADSEPDTIIIISPHMTHYPHLFNVCGMADLYGSLSNYGLEDSEWHGHNNIELAEEIVDKCEDEDLPTILYNSGEGEYEIDHGTMVPISFFKDQLEFSAKFLPVSYSIGTRGQHYSFGQVISEICESKTDERIAIIASGDLSHRLIGQNKEAGEKFDQELIASIKKGDEYSVVNMDETLIEEAGECGYRSILVLLGALSGRDYKPEVYSYEGPFGVGYLVANMRVA
jgi:aromatic ring-opening dioxygenase LigB subunit